MNKDPRSYPPIKIETLEIDAKRHSFKINGEEIPPSCSKVVFSYDTEEDLEHYKLGVELEMGVYIGSFSSIDGLLHGLKEYRKLPQRANLWEKILGKWFKR